MLDRNPTAHATAYDERQVPLRLGDCSWPQEDHPLTSVGLRRECKRSSSPRTAPPCIIYRPSRSVMQGGSRSREAWVLEFERQRPGWTEPLMGWNASDDPYAQIRLTFPTLESAIRHAKREGLDFRVIGLPTKRNDTQHHMSKPTSTAKHSPEECLWLRTN